ncbi:MAG: hypothetical protein EAZ53_12115 [Bacteroidetes bacterium]|nr:MAG: hypothetical protein EAZ53_12115 [Bacteroidota bacterium]
MEKIDFKDYEASVMREKLLLHKFLFEIYEYFWVTRNDSLEVLHAEIDNFGYDIVVCANKQTKHIQLKSLVSGGTTASFKINDRLELKTGGCVVIQEYEQVLSEIKVKYHFFDAKDLSSFNNAKHTKANADGEKKIREGIKEVPKGKFISFKSSKEFIEFLFPLN